MTDANTCGSRTWVGFCQPNVDSGRDGWGTQYVQQGMGVVFDELGADAELCPLLWPYMDSWWALWWVNFLSPFADQTLMWKRASD